MIRSSRRHAPCKLSCWLTSDFCPTRGKNALTNFDVSLYPDALERFENAKGKGRSSGFLHLRKKKTQAESHSDIADTPVLDISELLDPSLICSSTQNQGWDEQVDKWNQESNPTFVPPRVSALPGCELSSSTLDFDGNACTASSTGTDMLCALLSQDIAELIRHI